MEYDHRVYEALDLFKTYLNDERVAPGFHGREAFMRSLSERRDLDDLLRDMKSERDKK